MKFLYFDYELFLFETKILEILRNQCHNM